MAGSGSRSRTQDQPGGDLIADRYQLKTRLGRGGMGEVWSARDLRLRRDVAVKLFQGGEGMSASTLPDWLRREGIAAAQIIHPNVAVVYDQGAHHDHIFLVMELVSGATLEEIMRGGRLPVRDALKFGTQIAEALAAAHAARVVHRDIKPQNVLVTPDGAVKVVDFGIAGFLADTRSWTIARFEDTVKGSGTPEYAAPEQVMGHNADARSDLYSLGTLLYAMLAGQVPFRADNFLQVMHMKATEDAPPLPAGAGVPRELADLVAELLVRDPERRPGSARHVAARLRTLMERPVRGEAEVEGEGADSLDRKSRVGDGAGGGDERGSDSEVVNDERAGDQGGAKVASAAPWTAPPVESAEGSAERKPAAKLKAQVAPAAEGFEGGAESAVSQEPWTAPPAEPAAKPKPAEKPPAWGPDASRITAPKPSPKPAGTPESPKPKQPSPGPKPPESAPAPAKKAQPKPAPSSAPAKRPAPKPKPKPAEPEKPAWGPGSSKEHVAPPEPSAWEPLAETGATVLSAAAEIEVRGRSLLPPPARSLLVAGPSGERYVPSLGEPQVPVPPKRSSARVVVVVMLLVVVAAVVGVVLATR